MRSTLLAFEFLGTPFVLDAYGTMLRLGAVAGIALALLLARSRGLPVARSFAVLTAAAVSVPLGARVLSALTEPGLFAEEPGLLTSTSLRGFALYGGLALAAVVGALGARVARVDLWRLADAAAPGIALGLVAARLGCYCEGCCHGIETSGPLGVVFPLGSPVHAVQMLDGTTGLLGPIHPVLPTQLFEATGAALFGVLALWLGRHSASGVGFLTLAAGFSAVRWAVLPLRWIGPTFAAPDWFYPALYAAVVLVCGVLVIVRVRAGRAAPPSGSATM